MQKGPKTDQQRSKKGPKLVQNKDQRDQMRTICTKGGPFLNMSKENRDKS